MDVLSCSVRSRRRLRTSASVSHHLQKDKPQRNYTAIDLVATHACLVILTRRSNGGDCRRLDSTEASRGQAQVGGHGEAEV